LYQSVQMTIETTGISAELKAAVLSVELEKSANFNVGASLLVDSVN